MHPELFECFRDVIAHGLVGLVECYMDANILEPSRDYRLRAIHDGVLKAYRWQYIVSRAQDGKFLGVLTSMVTQPQLERISDALAPLM
jgi:hypothetical protein